MSVKDKSVASEQELVMLTPKEFLPIAKDHIEHGESFGVEGPPGCGKTSIPIQAAKEVGLITLISNGELEDTTDGKGLPFRDVDNPNQIVWLKDKKYLIDFKALWLHDDLARAPTNVIGVKATLFLENRIDDLYLPEGTCHCWTGNRTFDKAGANRIPTMFYDRGFVYGLDYDAESQVEYMLQRNDLDMLTLRFLRMKGNSALSFDPAKKINSTSRAWTAVAEKLHQNAYTPYATIAGRIGKGLASELLSFRDLAPQLPSVEEVMLAPDKARVPDNTSAQFLITDMMADQASVNSFDTLVTYAKRLPPEMQAKFVKDSLTRKPEVSSTSAFVKWGVKFAEVLR